jgi:hypothetical protein
MFLARALTHGLPNADMNKLDNRRESIILKGVFFGNVLSNKNGLAKEIRLAETTSKQA